MWFKYLLIGLCVLDSIAVVATVGAQREPRTGADAAIQVAVYAAVIWGLLAKWVK